MDSKELLDRFGITDVFDTVDVEAAVEQLCKLDKLCCDSISAVAERVLAGETPDSIGQMEFNYPWVGVYIKDATLKPEYFHWSFGFVREGPGLYGTTVTAMELLKSQYALVLERLVQAHGCRIMIGTSRVPKPLKYAVTPELFKRLSVECSSEQMAWFTHVTNQEIAISNTPISQKDNPSLAQSGGQAHPVLTSAREEFYLPAKRRLNRTSGLQTDYALTRVHYVTGSPAKYVQPYVIFTNFDDYMWMFREMGEKLVAEGKYKQLVLPDFVVNGGPSPQTPAYHLIGKDLPGITLVNVSIGQAAGVNAIKALCPLRPTIIMAGKCGGLSLNHVIGNYILPQGAFFLDAGHGPQSSPHQAIVQPFLPIGEIQGSLRRAVKSRYSLSEREVSKKIQGGLVGSTSDRMSEVEIEQLLRLLPTQAIGLEMEVAYFALTCQQKEIPFGALLLIGDIIKEGTFPNPGSTVHEEYGRDHLEIIFEAIRLLDENPLSVNSRGLKTGLSTPFI